MKNHFILTWVQVLLLLCQLPYHDIFFLFFTVSKFESSNYFICNLNVKLDFV